MASGKQLNMSSIRERLSPDTRIKVLFDGDEQPRFVLGYWSIRGLAAPLRAMLSAAQVDHEIILYDLTEDEGHGWQMATYAADKQWLKDEYDCFVNLPFLVDTKGDMVLSHTNAIFNYLGRELKMNGKDEIQQAKVEEMLCEIMDLRDKMVHFVYSTECSVPQAEALLKTAKVHLRKFEHHLAQTYPDYFKSLMADESNGPKTSEQAKDGICHLIPGCFTTPDFHLWEMLDQYAGLASTYGLPLWGEKGDEKAKVINYQARPDVKPSDRPFPYLEEFMSNFMLLPENKSYVESYLHKELPCNNCPGSFASCEKSFKKYTRGQLAPWRAKGEVTFRYTKI